MLGIPEWALGVTAILAVVSVLKVVTARLMPPGYRQRSWRGTTARIAVKIGRAHV